MYMYILTYFIRKQCLENQKAHKPISVFIFIDFRNIAKLSNTTYYSNKVFIKILQS